jgi:hypothetical protein
VYKKCGIKINRGGVMKKGYRLHIEAMTTEPTRFESMADVRVEQRRLARKYSRTLKEIDAISYIVTEEEYQAEQAEK